MEEKKYLLVFYGFCLATQAGVTIEVPSEYQTLEQIVEYSKEASKKSGVCPRLAYVKETTENGTVLSKVGTQKYLALVLLQNNEKAKREGEQVFINEEKLYHVFPQDREVKFVYPN